MNCNKYRKQLLLATSGELSDKATDKLKMHMGTCEACRDFERSLVILTRTAAETMPESEPHPSVMVAIRNAARAHGKQNRAIWFARKHQYATAYAAAVLLLVGSAIVLLNRSDRSTSTTIPEISAMVACLSTSLKETYEQEQTITEEADNMQELAQQLLELEGFSTDNHFSEETILTLFEEPLPTTTQRHNNPASPATECA